MRRCTNSRCRGKKSVKHRVQQRRRRAGAANRTGRIVTNSQGERARLKQSNEFESRAPEISQALTMDPFYVGAWRGKRLDAGWQHDLVVFVVHYVAMPYEMDKCSGWACS